MPFMNSTRPKNPKSVDSGPIYRLKKELNLAKKSIFHGFLPMYQLKIDLETQKFQNVKKTGNLGPNDTKKVNFDQPW